MGNENWHAILAHSHSMWLNQFALPAHPPQPRCYATPLNSGNVYRFRIWTALEEFNISDVFICFTCENRVVVDGVLDPKRPSAFMTFYRFPYLVWPPTEWERVTASHECIGAIVHWCNGSHLISNRVDRFGAFSPTGAGGSFVCSPERGKRRKFINKIAIKCAFFAFRFSIAFDAIHDCDGVCPHKWMIIYYFKRDSVAAYCTEPCCVYVHVPVCWLDNVIHESDTIFPHYCSFVYGQCNIPNLCTLISMYSISAQPILCAKSDTLFWSHEPG